MNVTEVVRELGRGRQGARNLSREEAQGLYGCMLDGQVPDLESGAITIALRIKGETAEEMHGFLNATLERMPSLRNSSSKLRPIVIPSYNGARKEANLTALLALLLRRFGLFVVIHGLMDGYERVTTAQILREFDLTPCCRIDEAQQHLNDHGLAIIPLSVLSPDLNNQLCLRERLGLRNSAHSLVKMLDPFKGDGVVLAAATHPDYLDLMRDVIVAASGQALLFRGTEGEPFANPKRCPRIDYLHDKTCETLVEARHDSLKALPDLPKSFDAKSTAHWMRLVLAGKIASPQSIVYQLASCLLASAYTKDIESAIDLIKQKGFEVGL